MRPTSVIGSVYSLFYKENRDWFVDSRCNQSARAYYKQAAHKADRREAHCIEWEEEVLTSEDTEPVIKFEPVVLEVWDEWDEGDPFYWSDLYGCSCRRCRKGDPGGCVA